MAVLKKWWKRIKERRFLDAGVTTVPALSLVGVFHPIFPKLIEVFDLKMFINSFTERVISHLFLERSNLQLAAFVSSWGRRFLDKIGKFRVQLRFLRKCPRVYYGE